MPEDIGDLWYMTPKGLFQMTIPPSGIKWLPRQMGTVKTPSAEAVCSTVSPSTLQTSTLINHLHGTSGMTQWYNKKTRTSCPRLTSPTSWSATSSKMTTKFDLKLRIWTRIQISLKLDLNRNLVLDSNNRSLFKLNPNSNFHRIWIMLNPILIG